MKLTYMDYHSNGTIEFTMGVNTSCFEDMELFWKTFNVYVLNTVKSKETIRDIEFLVLDNKTVNFTVRFQHPYMYGLLNKKNDLLTFVCLNETFLLANATNQTLSSNTTTKRVGMQFDFRDEKM